MTYTPDDYITLAVFAALFGMACGAIGYLVGLSHGKDRGWLAGVAEELRNSRARIIAHKKASFKLGFAVAVKWLIHGETVPARRSARAND